MGSHLQRKDNNNMVYLADGETSAVSGSGQNEHMDSTLRPAEPRMNSGNGISTANVPFASNPDAVNPVSNWSNMSSRMGDAYPSSSNQSTPLSTDLKSPTSIRTISTPELGNSLISAKRSGSNDQIFTDSSGTFDTNRVNSNSSIPAYPNLQRSNSFKSAPHPPLFPDARASRPGFNPPTSAGNYRPSPASNYSEPALTNGINYQHPSNGFINDPPMPQSSFPSLPPPAFSHIPQGHQGPQVIIPNSLGQGSSTGATSNLHQYGTSSLDTSYFDPTGGSHPMPTYDTDGQSRSPFAMADDFTAWLFNEPYTQSSSPGGHRQGSQSVGTSTFVDDPVLPQNGQFGLSDGSMGGFIGGNMPQQHPMAVTSILEPPSLHSKLSPETRKKLIEFIETKFTDYDFKDTKENLLKGDCEAAGHVLSMQSLQNYIHSYWVHFHPQMPILHKPTFSADKEQNLLLFAIICIGASCLDKAPGQDLSEASADLSSFLAWHLRGEIFKDKHFLPPAKLWVFQTLLLLEIYEKMYADRKLHERAHIHHATTLTLMRRGSSLIGRTSLDSPPLLQDERTGRMNSTDQGVSSTKNSDEWWKRWILNEATRRVAFAAFIVDSIHATMFGHSATMVAHEMKLALPCEESLWSATSSAEVARIETRLQSQGTKSMTFFEGLKDTLKEKPVNTNPFGRTAIMAGLLSVTWHMNQRDVQIHHLGALKALGGKDMWRLPLTKAFGSWKKEFDSSMERDSMNNAYPPGRLDGGYIFESRIVLYHLAHMAMNVDVVSCQIFAKATRLLGRTTLPSDYDIAQKRIRLNWAPRASARHATFYALQFLRLVLLPKNVNTHTGVTSKGAAPFSTYSAREDFLLNQPWVLYYAVLVVWSYGYALDGILTEPRPLKDAESQHADMIAFLTRVGGIGDPWELERMRNRNDCLGLLYVVRDKFNVCRWELLREAANLLDNCIKMLRGTA